MVDRLIPHHIAAAVDQMTVQPDDFLLEIGCGNGTAAALVCQRLNGGRLVAIDRSEKQIALARQRNRAQLETGKITLHTMSLETARLGLARFDKIFAINVNCFWLRAEQPLGVVKQLLKPGGLFFTFYHQPTPARTREVMARVRSNLIKAGFVIKAETDQAGVYCLVSFLPAATESKPTG